jgi:hypothetical protein
MNIIENMHSRISSASCSTATQECFFISNPFRSPVRIPITRLYRYKQGHIRASSESPQLSKKLISPTAKCNLIVSPHIYQNPFVTSPKMFNKKPAIRMMIQKMLHQRDIVPKRKFTLTPVIGNSLRGTPSLHKFPFDTKCRKGLIQPSHKFLYRTYDKIFDLPWSKKKMIRSGKISTENKSIIMPLKAERCSRWENEKEDASFSNGILNVN